MLFRSRAVQGSVSQLERQVFERSNALRSRRGLEPLDYDAALARVARAHSEDMRDDDFVGHVSRRTGRPVDRLVRAGVVHLVVRENVARAYSPAEAVREFMNSPGHRDNLLSRDVTRIGVGVAVDRDGATPILLVTQLFVAPGTDYDPRTARADVLRSLQRSRARAGIAPLRTDDQLQKLAASYLEALLSSAGKGAADAALGAALKQLGGRYSQVDGVHLRVAAIEAIESAEETRRKRHTHVGIAVTKREGQILVFLLLGVGR